jgi:hypothetical protein
LSGLAFDFNLHAVKILRVAARRLHCVHFHLITRPAVHLDRPVHVVEQEASARRQRIDMLKGLIASKARER